MIMTRIPPFLKYGSRGASETLPHYYSPTERLATDFATEPRGKAGHEFHETGCSEFKL